MCTPRSCLPFLKLPLPLLTRSPVSRFVQISATQAAFGFPVTDAYISLVTDPDMDEARPSGTTAEDFYVLPPTMGDDDTQVRLPRSYRLVALWFFLLTFFSVILLMICFDSSC